MKKDSKHSEEVKKTDSTEKETEVSQDTETRSEMFKENLSEEIMKSEHFQNMSEEEIRRNQKIMNWVTGIGLILTALLCIYAWRAGYFTDKEKLTALLNRAGLWGPFLFILLQVIQCVIPIIPGGVTCLIGVVVFGPWAGFAYNYFGIILGEVIGFWLARIYGRALVRTLFSEKSYNKYIGWLDKGNKFDIFFALAILFPFAPDDLLCMIAGLTNMTFRRYFLIILFLKPPSILVYTLFLETAVDVIQYFI